MSRSLTLGQCKCRESPHTSVDMAVPCLAAGRARTLAGMGEESKEKKTQG
eukprot:SAG22_NODE_1858_length_3437_cov_1.175554_3_plen_50_part_00